jgi:arylsulfatase A-like enzyme
MKNPILSLAFALSTTIALSFAPAVHAAESCANICILLADDLRTGCLGVLGDPIVKTPNLDKVCKDGFIFRNAYVMGANNSAVCFPSRQMILRSVSYLRPGFKNPATPTMAETFRKAGYLSIRAGKPKNGDEVFDENQDGSHAEGNADYLVEFIKKNAGGKNPLFLYMAGHEPHDHQYAPDSYYSMYKPADMPMPVSFLPYHPFDTGALLEADETRTLKWPRTKEALQTKFARYYASISYWDAEAGRVIEALKQAGQYENTIFVVSSDNGLSMGDHGLMGKQNLYEFGGMHSFAIFAGPGIPKGDSKALTCLMDIYPTLCELTHTAIPENLDGKSLVPVIAGKSAKVRDTLITGFKNNQRSIRDDRWKLIRYPLINKTQLFDLQADPHEMTDLSGKAEHAERIKALMAALEERLKFYGDEDPLAVKKPGAAAWDPNIGEAEVAKRAAQKPKKKRPMKGTLE